MTLFHPIDLQSRLNPDNLALAFESVAETLSFGELRRLVRGAAGVLESSGVTSNRRIGVHCQNPFLQIVCALAASHVGVNAVVISPLGDFPSGSVDVVVSDASVTAPGAQVLRIEAPALFKAPGPRARADGQTNPLWVFLTAARAANGADALAVKERGLKTRIMMRAMAKGGAFAGQLLCAADIRSEIGFSAILESLWFGNAVVLSRGTLDEDARSIALYDVGSIFLAAGALPDYLRGFQPKRAHGVHPKRMIVAGTDVEETLLVGVKQHLCAHVAVHLDMAEVGGFAASAPWQIDTPRIYWPFSGATLAVVGGDGRQVAPEVSGTIVIRSEGANAPAAGDPAANRFRDGWFISPLNGSLHANGGLVLR